MKINWKQVIPDLLLILFVVAIVVLVGPPAINGCSSVHKRAVEYEDAKATGSIEAWQEVERYRNPAK